MEERDGDMQLSSAFDCGRAFQNMKLAATDRGLGSVPQSIDNEQAKEVLNIPDTKRVVIALAVGHPAEHDDTIEGKEKERVLASMTRNSLDDLIHWERHR
jgi:nitroreductase